MAKRRPPPRRKRPLPASFGAELIELANGGQFEEIVRQCEKSSKRAPLSSTCLFAWGVAQIRLGNLDAGINTLKRADSKRDESASPEQTLAILSELSKAYFSTGKLDQAEEILRALYEQNPGRIEIARNLLLVLERSNRIQDAIDACNEIIKNWPDDARLAYQLGDLHMANQSWRLAADSFSKCLVLDPDHDGARGRLVSAYRSLGDQQSVAETLIRWLEHDPDNPVVAHLVSAQEVQDSPSESPPPPRASDEYVREVFDRFAETFDDDLDALGYGAPKIIASLMSGLNLPTDGQLSGLDAGCGTGKMGEHLKPYCSRLVGVDLSSEMIQRATERSYDELVCQELVEYLNEQNRSFDLIVSADTFNYFGDLAAAFRAAFNALRAVNSYLIFSLESRDSESPAGPNGFGYQLNPSGRYSHDQEYIRRILTEAGFTNIRIHEGPLRNESDREVSGQYWIAQRAAD